MDFIRKHRELAVMLAAVVLLAAAVYISAMLRPGLWFGEAFLYETGDGTYLEKDGWSALEIKSTTEGARAVYRAGEDSREYRLTTRTRMTEIFQDGRLKFRGTVQPEGDGFRFLNERGEPIEAAETVDGFPDFRQVYAWTMGRDTGRRGNPWVLVPLAILLVLLTADFLCPDWVQKLGKAPGPAARNGFRVLMAAGVLLFLFLGFHHFA